MALDFAHVGAAFREIRELAKLKQWHVAEHLNVTDGAVSQWESGARELKVSQLQQFAALVGLDFDGLLFKLGYLNSPEARERYVTWLLARYAESGTIPATTQSSSESAHPLPGWRHDANGDSPRSRSRRTRGFPRLPSKMLATLSRVTATGGTVAQQAHVL